MERTPAPQRNGCTVAGHRECARSSPPSNSRGQCHRTILACLRQPVARSYGTPSPVMLVTGRRGFALMISRCRTENVRPFTLAFHLCIQPICTTVVVPIRQELSKWRTITSMGRRVCLTGSYRYKPSSCIHGHEYVQTRVRPPLQITKHRRTAISTSSSSLPHSDTTASTHSASARTHHPRIP